MGARRDQSFCSSIRTASYWTCRALAACRSSIAAIGEARRFFGRLFALQRRRDAGVKLGEPFDGLVAEDEAHESVAVVFAPVAHGGRGDLAALEQEARGFERFVS